MDAENRSRRIADTLERHLTSCDTALAACLANCSPDEMIGEWALKRILGLMKMSAQLASAIARLDAQKAPRIAKSEV